MPPALATQPRWRYWHARAIAATSGDAAAAALFGEIAGLRDYYGYLAADRVAQPYNLNVRPSPLDAAAQTRLSKIAGMIRAHELFDCDMADEAASEWNAALDGADNALKVQAALLASRWGWFAQSITTLAQTGEFDDVTLRYPRPFSDVVSRAAKTRAIAAGLDTGRHAPGEPVSQGRRVPRGCSRPDANGACRRPPPSRAAGTCLRPGATVCLIRRSRCRWAPHTCANFLIGTASN